MPTDGLPPGYRKQDALSVRLHDLVDALESQVPLGRPPLPVRSSRPAGRRQLVGQLAVALSVIGVLAMTMLGSGDAPGGTAVVPTDRTGTFAPSAPGVPPVPVAPSLDGPAAPPDDAASPDAPAPLGGTRPDHTPDPKPAPAPTRNRAPARDQQQPAPPPTSTSSSASSPSPSPSSSASSPQPDGNQSSGGQSNGNQSDGSQSNGKQKKDKKPKKDKKDKNAA